MNASSQRLALMALALDSETPAVLPVRDLTEADLTALAGAIPARHASVARALCAALYLRRRGVNPVERLADVLAHCLGERELTLLGDAAGVALVRRAEADAATAWAASVDAATAARAAA